MTIESRKDSEQSFHNVREQLRRTDPTKHDATYTNRRFYRTTGKSQSYVRDILQVKCPGKLVLDYCCGNGEMSIEMAQYGATVTGIDISDVSIETAAERAEKLGLENKPRFLVMDAENLEVQDGSYDLVLCSGVLHHLDLSRAYSELARVVKQDGVVLCIEALADNPLIQWYRRHTPHLRTPWEVDHILSSTDIHRARGYFQNVSIRYFHLASIGAIPLIGTPFFHPAMAFLNAADEVLMRVPVIRQMAWQAVFTLSSPKTGGN